MQGDRTRENRTRSRRRTTSSLGERWRSRASRLRGRFERWFEVEVVDPIADFKNPRQEWRRLFSEFYGTFFLVLVAAGGGMMSQAFPDTISRTAAVVAPGLMVMGIILFMGKVSGAHLNPAVTLGVLAARRLPVAAGAGLHRGAAARRHARGVDPPAHHRGLRVVRFQLSRRRLLLVPGVHHGGAADPRPRERHPGHRSGAQNVGVIGALGVGSYIALAGLWGSPISGASMNPARTFGPDLAGLDFTAYWVYVAGPIAGAVAAVLLAFVLRGYGGGRSGSVAAQGDLDTDVSRPDQS